VLESGLPLLWLEGGTFELRRPRLRTLVFLAQGRQCPGALRHVAAAKTAKSNSVEDGMAVLVRARAACTARGEFTAVEHLEEAGEGALKREFES